MTTASFSDGAGRLAIVIPAWRARHFAAALESLRAQTDRRFRLYIGDDGSPDDLRSIVEACTAGMEVVYHRFPENLGGRDLVAHWARCIALTRDEPWIWLFSDDDIAEPGCVADFHRQVEEGVNGATLLRFNLVMIDGDNRMLRRPEPHPQRENAMELIVALLTDRSRWWCAPDHIFARDTYVRTGGFVAFPKALHSDLATWVRFTADGHVLTLPGPGIRFRQHEAGTSSGMLQKYRGEMIESLFGYSDFILETTARLAPERAAEIRRAVLTRVQRVLNALQAGDGKAYAMIGQCLKVSVRVRAVNAVYLWRHALRIFIRCLPGLKQFSSWRYRRGLARTTVAPADLSRKHS